MPKDSNNDSDQQPYLGYSNYRTMSEMLMQRTIYKSAPETESQFKQPWTYPNYPLGEGQFAFPGNNYPTGEPTDVTPGGVNIGLADCEVQGDALGGGAFSPCIPGLNCGTWIFSCAHKIIRFSVLEDWGTIVSIQYGVNDTVQVTVCWDEDRRGAVVGGVLNVVMNNGKAVDVDIATNRCLGETPNVACTSCADCGGAATKPVISYTTQQMSASGTQALSTSGGGGGVYRWYLSGGGSLSLKETNSSQQTTYTAPSTNAECANNGSIFVVDFCGNTSATLKIAVNANTGTDIAYRTIPSSPCTCAYCCWSETPTTCCPGYGGGFSRSRWLVGYNYKCDGTSHSSANCGTQGQDCCGPACGCQNCSDYLDCSTCLTQCETANPSGDKRTAAMKTAGCCPAALL